jgi:hypothetical protein
MASVIQHLTRAGRGRQTNDSLNKIREQILTRLYNPPKEYLDDSTYGRHWKEFSRAWNMCLEKKCPVPFDNVVVNRFGGRKNHKDIEIVFSVGGKECYRIASGEFKHNSRTIDKIPQYANIPEKKEFTEKSYAEFFYDHYLDSICRLVPGLQKPPKHEYMKLVYQTNHTKHTFFATLRAHEDNMIHAKKVIVNKSISEFLQKYAQSLSIKKLEDYIKATQKEKLFILWDLKEFHTDTIRDDELELTNIVRVKNNNTIVVNSKAGTTHNLLLRWKNQAGILYPAWQISLKRSGERA